MTGLEGKAAVVFGAGSSNGGVSIGRAIAWELARRGARIVAVDRDQAAAEETAGRIRSDGLSAIPFTADVSDAERVEASVGACLEAFGAVDAGVFNVGIQHLASIVDIEPEDWRRSYDVNVTGALNCVRALLKPMIAGGGGSITFVSSIAAIRASRTPNVAYATSKAALDRLVTEVAVAHGRDGIRANAVRPGLIDTPMIRAAFSSDPQEIEAIMAERSARPPLGRMGTVEEVANAVAFLASDQAAYVSGAVLPVDGALSVRMA